MAIKVIDATVILTLVGLGISHAVLLNNNGDNINLYGLICTILALGLYSLIGLTYER